MAPPAPAPAARLVSLDVFRGGAIAAMILVNNAGDGKAVYPPLLHAGWHGWTFTDIIFPSFLWIVGVAMTLSFARRVGRGDGRGKLFLHAARRSAKIFALGLFLNAFPDFRLETLRIPGVLQRIAVCYLAASAIFLLSPLRGQITALVCLLASYWALMKLVPVPGYGAGVLGQQGNFAQWIDSLVLSGHMYGPAKIYDPEGIVSTLPAIATVLFGILCGHLLRAPQSAAAKSAWMFVSGNALVFLGMTLDHWLPINKNLRTTSFSVFMAGIAFIAFGLCYWLIDACGWWRWTKPAVVFGANAITVYALSGVLAKGLSEIRWTGAEGQAAALRSWIYDSWFAPLASPVDASLLYAAANVLVLYWVAWAMHRRGWIVRL